ncbi:MAG: NTP transferase domain-containing protein [Candidatus Nomurabacteria bacterium]|jgi:mannose-1-phosphate guanylyltransferase/mannose-6-phosphate isomerase|nr:NTP transferase domain-containing protein [Candidatus Nomurabacteria bacterium]
MIVVIIAGGSGTRLWPLSTSGYPKHLLNLTGESTMLQLAYKRAKAAGDEVYIVTEASHSDHVKAQVADIPDDHFLIEPGRRGTTNCILMALDIISRTHGKDEPIAFIHSDHVIEDIDSFVDSFHKAAAASQENGIITLVGIEPTYPATGFGYIKKGERNGCVYKVVTFKEKPDLATAEEYLASGDYVWNAGYFIGSAKTFLKEIDRSSPSMKESWNALTAVKEFPSEEYSKAYLGLKDDAIDFSLMEPAKELLVLPATFDWADVGSFNDLHDLLIKDNDGNYYEGVGINMIDTKDMYIRNEEDKPIAVIGIDNIVVVNTKAGLLVARKDVAHRTGEVAKKLQAERSKK